MKPVDADVRTIIEKFVENGKHFKLSKKEPAKLIVKKVFFIKISFKNFKFYANFVLRQSPETFLKNEDFLNKNYSKIVQTSDNVVLDSMLTFLAKNDVKFFVSGGFYCSLL